MVSSDICGPAGDEECVSCPCCSWTGKSLPHHKSKFQKCKEWVAPPAVIDQAPPVAVKTSNAMEVASLERNLQAKLADLRLDNIMLITHIHAAIGLAEAAVSHARTLALRSVNGTHQCSQVTAAFDTIMGVLKKLHDVPTTCKAAAPDAVLPVKRGIGPANTQKQWYAFNSTAQLIVDTLVKDKYSRTRWITASEEWETGRFREEPAIKSDIVHARNFRESALARPAEPGEETRVRIGVVKWNDDFTVCTSSPPRPLLAE